MNIAQSYMNLPPFTRPSTSTMPGGALGQPNIVECLKSTRGKSLGHHGSAAFALCIHRHNLGRSRGSCVALLIAPKGGMESSVSTVPTMFSRPIWVCVPLEIAICCGLYPNQDWKRNPPKWSRAALKKWMFLSDKLWFWVQCEIWLSEAPKKDSNANVQIICSAHDVFRLRLMLEPVNQ